MVQPEPALPEKIITAKLPWQERREAIMRNIIDSGHPDLVSRTQFAKRFGVSVAMVSKDIAVIKEQLRKEIGKDAHLITWGVYDKVIKDLLMGSNDDKFKAAKLLKDLNDWLFDTGRQKREAIRIEGDVRHRVSMEQLQGAFREVPKEAKAEIIDVPKKSIPVYESHTERV